MEHQRFEDFTRGLATARSRRDVVKAFFGTLVAGGAVAAQRGGALAVTPCKDDIPCAENEICCVGICQVLECCIDDADPNARCPEGESCFEGICASEGPTACESDDACAEGEICCAGGCLEIECCIDEADPNARCPEGTSCFEGMCDPIPEPGACASDDECGEDHICCAGFCRDIECCIDEEDPNARCPEGTSCFEGICDPIPEPVGCSSDDECGYGEICCAGGCHAIECCIDDDDPNARCPEGTSCFEGYCDPIEDGGKKPPVVKLPSTGSGSASGGSSGMLSAILAGGAAVAAGLGLRARRAQPAEAEVEDR